MMLKSDDGECTHINVNRQVGELLEERRLVCLNDLI